jgi:NAD(P)-dependent dehydrogenase (short-subunit alcohol dehydrogenase family)
MFLKMSAFEDLKGKVCVITGGGGVIGRVLAEGLASAGVRVAALGLAEANVAEVAAGLTASYGVPAIGVAGNVLDQESLFKAKAKIHEALGPIDLLVNCAGGNSPKATTAAEFVDPSATSLEGTFFGLDIDSFNKVFNLNFIGTVLPTMVFSQDMVARKAGAVLNVSSMNSYRPLTKIPSYSAAKASINNFTEWLAVHLAKVNVRVNAIAPGFFLTKQNRFLLTDQSTGELTPRGNKILSLTPAGRFGDPQDLQGPALFLLSNLSQFVTGVVLPVDGGFNAYSGV